jgi:hypothetical protein
MTQPTLFSSDHSTTKTRPPDLFAIAAQKLHNMPVDWVPLRYEIKESPYGKFYEITGAVPLRCFTKGKYKGKPVWPQRKDCEVFRFTLEQKEQVRIAWEAETGNCSTCGGDSQEFIGWSRVDGNRYRQCSRCWGTGRAPLQESVKSDPKHTTPSAPQAPELVDS